MFIDGYGWVQSRYTIYHFYGHFDRDNKEVASKAVLPADHQPLTLSHQCVRGTKEG